MKKKDIQYIVHVYKDDNVLVDKQVFTNYKKYQEYVNSQHALGYYTSTGIRKGV